MSDDGKTAFETAYAKYADMMYRIALSHLGVREDAEDAVQDTFIKYIQSHPPFENEEHERAWLIRVTVNRSLDLIRRRSHRGYVTFDEVGEIAERDEVGDAGHIISLVSALPEKYKSVIILHCLEEYSVEQTANILGLSQSAVKMRLSRGRDMLRKKMDGAD